jgi:hypothetical protein
MRGGWHPQNQSRELTAFQLIALSFHTGAPFFFRLFTVVDRVHCACGWVRHIE